MYSRGISIAVAVLLLLCLLAVIPTTTGTQIQGGAMAEDNTLDKYIGREFKVYLLGRLGSSDSIDYLDRAREILYLVSNNASQVSGALTFEGYATYLNENISVYRGTYSNREIAVAIGDLGLFLIRIGDGKTGAYHICNLSLEELRAHSIIRDQRLSLKYKGQYGEETVERIVGIVCNVTNGTKTCYTPATPRTERFLENPYEIYYIYLDGLRIEPPIRIRCSIPKYNEGFKAVYAEGFIPYEIAGETSFILTSDRAGEILDTLHSKEPSINNLGDIVVEDIYLSPILGDKLVPVLKLRYRNIIAVVALDTDTSILLSIGVFIGEPHNGEIHGTVIDWDNILSSATKPSALEKNNIHVGIGDIVIALSFILVPIAIVTIIAYTVVKAED